MWELQNKMRDSLWQKYEPNIAGKKKKEPKKEHPALPLQ
jgi:hypothetical protein